MDCATDACLALADNSSSSAEGSPASSSGALTLRVVALFVVLAAGFTGVASPMFAKRSPSSPVFTICKTFGAGIILGTAFIHVLPDASETMEQAMPDVDYPVSQSLALAAVMVTLAIEQLAAMYFSREHSQSGHSCKNGGQCEATGQVNADKANENTGLLGKQREQESTEGPTNEEAMDSVTHRLHHHHQHQHSALVADGGRSFVIAHVLEIGIGIHSVIIGMALGVSADSSEVRALLIALSFHQLFEGMALGVCVLEASLGLARRVLAVLIFTLATPLGIAIGIWLSSRSAADSTSSLLTQCILDSLSAGILIYMALVDMVSEDFHASKKGPGIQFCMLVALILGGTVMAIIGIWA
eukprot:m51a1_g4955 putative zinc iron (357) ;mRNA; f:343820-345132